MPDTIMCWAFSKNRTKFSFSWSLFFSDKRKKENKSNIYSSINAVEENKEDRRMGVLGGSCYIMVVKERIFDKVVFQ